MILCKKCNTNKQEEEFSFRKDTNKYRSECKECRASHSRKWWNDNSERHYDRRKKEYKENPQPKREKQNEYASKNREAEAERSRQWRKDNPEKVRSLNQAYYANNRTNILEQKKKYAKDKPEILKANSANRKARIRNVKIRTLTSKEWIEVVSMFEGKCAYCNCVPENLTVDHVIPVSRGGNHEKSNIVPSCSSCNSKKYNRTAEEYLNLDDAPPMTYNMMKWLNS